MHHAALGSESCTVRSVGFVGDDGTCTQQAGGVALFTLRLSPAVNGFSLPMACSTTTIRQD